jgi:hypothetical protein
MIYIKFDTDVFEYETTDIIKLFFKDEQTQKLTDEMSVKCILGENVLDTDEGVCSEEDEEDKDYQKKNKEYAKDGEIFLRTWIERNKDCHLFMLSLKGKDFSTLIKIPLQQESKTSLSEYFSSEASASESVMDKAFSLSPKIFTRRAIAVSLSTFACRSGT